LLQFRGEGEIDPNAIPQRDAKTENVYPFYIGRLNPPHLYHLLSLFTAIFIARKYGTKALFILGGGRAKKEIENPLSDDLKWKFITSKLGEFGFEMGSDYEIAKLGYSNSQLATFVKKESASLPGSPVTVVHIGGDKSEPKSKGHFVLDVDKFLNPKGLFILEGFPSATYKQAVIESGESRVSVIDEMGQQTEGVMSASLLRKTACNCLKLNPGDHTAAFKQWVNIFRPMYKNDKLSRDVFDMISGVTCGVAPPTLGGSRRKHTIRKLRNKKTFQRGLAGGRGRVVSRNQTKRRK
jgi:hypothetical protein